MVSPLALILVVVLPQGGPGRERTLVKSERVATCSLVAEHYRPRSSRADLPREIWLRSTGSPRRRVLLGTYERDADLVFSPDCKMIALNDSVGSNLSDVRLFRRVAELTYQPMASADPTGKAWAAFVNAYQIVDLNKFLAHTYSTAVAWSSDSQALLLRLSGQTGPGNRVDDWYCVYDVAAGEVSTGLAAMNRASVYVDGHLR